MQSQLEFEWGQHACLDDGCPGGFPVVSQWGLGGVPVVSRWCPGGVPVVSRWCPSGVPVVSQWCPGAQPGLSRWCPEEGSKSKHYSNQNRSIGSL